MKQTFSFNLVTELTDKGRASLLRTYEQVRANPRESDLEGYVAAVSKLPHDADEDLILHTVFGEVMALILRDTLESSMPDAQYWVTRLCGVEYQETVPALAPPEDVRPVVISLHRH